MRERRRFWQVHFSTVVLMVVCLAAATWKNIEGPTSSSLDDILFTVGWPGTYYADYKDLRTSYSTSTCGYGPKAPPVPYKNRSWTRFSIPTLLGNGVLIIGGLAGMAVIWESCLELASVRQFIRPINFNFQLHLSTLLMTMIMAGGLLGMNICVIQLPNTLFESGLPLFDWSRDSQYNGQMSLHIPVVVPINVALNLGLCVLFAISFEKYIRHGKAGQS